jgi:hypothetical protein
MSEIKSVFEETLLAEGELEWDVGTQENTFRTVRLRSGKSPCHLVINAYTDAAVQIAVTIFLVEPGMDGENDVCTLCGGVSFPFNSLAEGLGYEIPESLQHVGLAQSYTMMPIPSQQEVLFAFYNTAAITGSKVKLKYRIRMAEA